MIGDEEQDETPIDYATRLIQLNPAEIKIRKDLNVRKFPINGSGSTGEQETELIRQLAITLIEDSQLQPVLVGEEIKKSGETDYYLIAGARRRAAAELINSGALKSYYDPKKKGPFLLDCKVKEVISAPRARKAARLENIQRKQFNAMDLAMNISDILAENEWKDQADWSKLVADYLRVSRATVTQHYKLLELPKALQARVADGELTVNAAFAVLKTDEQQRQEVIEDAKKLAEQERRTKTTAGKGSGSSSGNAPVQRKHVVQAAREREALAGPSPRSRKEIRDLIESLCGPAYHKLMNGFAEAFLDWTDGKGTDSALIARWNQLDTVIAAHTPDKADKPKSSTKPAAKPPAKSTAKPRNLPAKAVSRHKAGVRARSRPKAA